MNYKEQQKDPRWQKKRLEIMQRDGFKCRTCSDHSTELNVHHAYYEWEKDYWDYPDFSLFTLCRDCHKRAGILKKACGVLMCKNNTASFAVEHLMDCIYLGLEDRALTALVTLQMESRDPMTDDIPCKTNK